MLATASRLCWQAFSGKAQRGGVSAPVVFLHRDLVAQQAEDLQMSQGGQRVQVLELVQLVVGQHQHAQLWNCICAPHTHIMLRHGIFEKGMCVRGVEYRVGVGVQLTYSLVVRCLIVIPLGHSAGHESL